MLEFKWVISLVLIMNGFNEIYIRDMTFILNIKGLFASLKGKGEKRPGMRRK